MILVYGRDWNVLCDLLSQSEQDEIEATMVSRTSKPRTVYFDETQLRPELLAKVKKHLDIKPRVSPGSPGGTQGALVQ